MRFNAGHALNYFNVQPVAALPGVRELHIGHAIVSRAVFVGLREAVAQMKALLREAARGHQPSLLPCRDRDDARSRRDGGGMPRWRGPVVVGIEGLELSPPIASDSSIRSSAASSCSRATSSLRRTQA